MRKQSWISLNISFICLETDVSRAEVLCRILFSVNKRRGLLERSTKEKSIRTDGQDLALVAVFRALDAQRISLLLQWGHSATDFLGDRTSSLWSWRRWNLRPSSSSTYLRSLAHSPKLWKVESPCLCKSLMERLSEPLSWNRLGRRCLLHSSPEAQDGELQYWITKIPKYSAKYNLHITRQIFTNISGITMPKSS